LFKIDKFIEQIKECQNEKSETDSSNDRASVYIRELLIYDRPIRDIDFSAFTMQDLEDMGDQIQTIPTYEAGIEEENEEELARNLVTNNVFAVVDMIERTISSFHRWTEKDYSLEDDDFI